jgi:predicted metal-dependent HD superfamily phosphohydrolase
VREIFTHRGADFHQEIFQKLQEAYGEKHRQYHTLRHIEEVLKEVNRFEWSDKRAVLAAALFHDSYLEMGRYARQPGEPSNEMLSAVICREVLHSGGVSLATNARAQDLILKTETHKAPEEDVEARRFLDIDNCILGAAHNRYLEYASANAREFLWVFTPEQYMTGRMAFLQGKLEGGPVYKTEPYTKREETARENMLWEFENLPQIVMGAALTHQVATYEHDYK